MVCWGERQREAVKLHEQQILTEPENRIQLWCKKIPQANMVQTLEKSEVYGVLYSYTYNIYVAFHKGSFGENRT